MAFDQHGNGAHKGMDKGLGAMGNYSSMFKGTPGYDVLLLSRPLRTFLLKAPMVYGQQFGRYG